MWACGGKKMLAYTFVPVCLHTYWSCVFGRHWRFFVTLPQARHHCSPVRQVLPTISANINKNLLPVCASSCCGSAGSHANAGPAQTACKAVCRPALQACQPCGQVSAARPSLASGCPHSMNDKAEMHEQHGAALIKKSGIKAVAGIYNPSARMRFVMKKCC